MNKLAGVVILYNPLDEVYENICSYYDYIDHLFIIDNSENPNIYLISKLKLLSKVEYIFHGENKGISFSLNEALYLSKNKFAWLMTMDQDSSFKKDMICDYIMCLDKIPDKVYGVTSIINNNVCSSKALDNLMIVERCITSGNIINIKIALDVGGFDENLFIDEVDIDFCYRCKKSGYILMQYQKNIMNHVIGNPIKGRFLGFQFSSMNHNYIRDYYIVRNRLYISKKYKELRKRYLVYIFKDIFKILLIGDDKFRKLKYIIKGIKDYKLNNMGKL